MYSTCLFCNRSLGRNEVVETFPVGRRLAFDGEKGRLWAVCPSCRRWNLTPLEERWEAIEECERIFRELRTRVHSEEIGAARHPEGLQLIRIGRPIPVEFATWRYGETMQRRMRRRALVTGAGAAGGLALIAGGILPATFAGSALFYGAHMTDLYDIYRAWITVRLPDGEAVRVRPWKVDLMNPETEGQLGVRVKLKSREIFLLDQDAREVAGKALPVLNRYGARKSTIRSAVGGIEEVGGMERFVRATWGSGRPRPGSGIRWIMSNDMKAGSMRSLPPETRFGLEMSLQEERERRAMEGELAVLEAAWKEAEALAKISDDLLVSPEVEEKLREMRGDGR